MDPILSFDSPYQGLHRISDITILEFPPPKEFYQIVKMAKFCLFINEMGLPGIQIYKRQKQIIRPIYQNLISMHLHINNDVIRILLF